MKQISFFESKVELEHGGSLAKGKRKTARPLSLKRPLHLVLKASSPDLLLRFRPQIRALNRRLCVKFGIIEYKLAVHADHLHMAIRIHSRRMYCAWIRALTGLLVKLIPGLKFSLRPYTLILSWGRQFTSTMAYIQHNQNEGDLMLLALSRMENWRGRG